MNEANFGGEKNEVPIDFDAKIPELKEIVDKAMKAQIPKEEKGHIYNPKLWQDLLTFSTKLQQKYGEDYYKYRVSHILGSSTLRQEDVNKTFDELKAEGIMIDFDFPGEDSVEDFLNGLDFSNSK